jgi:RNA polymerase sigma-70 factor (ECF subfamily)
MTGDGRLGAAFVRTRAEADFRALYRAVTPRSYGLALRLAGGNEDEAAELVQEAWVRAVERLERYRAGEPFGVWLRGFVVNCWRERLRSVRHAAEVELDDDLAAPESRVDQDSADFPAVDPDTLRRAVHALPAGFRTVLLLHDVEGYTHAEIADQLDVSEGTSKSQLSRARRRLRRMLDVAVPASDHQRSEPGGPT